MKKYFTIILLAASLVACTGLEQPEPIEEPNIPKTYTMTVKASKTVDTKALSLDDNTLNATWTENDEVKVYNSSSQLLGTLQAKDVNPDGTSCTLKGTLTTAPFDNQPLTLKYLTDSYGTQDGTLTGNATSIDKVCDCAIAEVHASVSGTSIGIKESSASFTNQQAIVKFTLKDIATGNPSINATQLTVTAGEMTITVTPSGATDELFVAVPGISAQAVSLSANITPGYVYTYEKASVTFANSQYYEITVKMTKQYADLSLLTADFVAVDGDVLKNFLSRDVSVAIANNAAVTLSGIYISKPSSSRTIPGITCNGNATIILADGTTNTVEGRMSRPGISVGQGYTLTIQGAGTLRAYGEHGGAGIGGGDSYYCGNIRIEGGIINAYGSTRSGNGAAGIGGGPSAQYGDITITGGTVYASGGEKAAGIGGGSYGYAINESSTITISGGSVTAQGGAAAAAIGTGYGTTYYMHYCGNISITGGTVTATCGTGAAAVIGRSSADNACGDITFGGAPNTPTVTLNNPNNSGEEVYSSSFMYPGNPAENPSNFYKNKHVYFPSWDGVENTGFSSYNGEFAGFNECNSQEGFQFGCFSATEFRYAPYSEG